MTSTTRPKITAIIFSKDRPLQLDATLQSFFLHCADPQLIQLHVLFRADDPARVRQYEKLAAAFPNIRFIRERHFRKTTMMLIRRRPMVLFLVDDCLFTRHFSLAATANPLRTQSKALGFSLRLGKNTTYCYPMRINQKLPKFRAVGRSLLEFNWTQSDLDFAYPLEVSSSLYRRSDLLKLLLAAKFENPNTLESVLYERRGLFQKQKPNLLCYESGVAFCNPVNMTQRVCPNNRAGQSPRYSIDGLSRLFEQGKRIDVRAYADFVPQGCHQEVPLRFYRKAG